jgi:ATP adenylyltransferase
MDKIYAPWRDAYVVKNTQKTGNKTCAFCKSAQSKEDTKNFVLKRYPNSVVLLNLYPYNAGHLLVIPNKHYKDLQSLTDNDRCELMYVVSESITALNKTLKPDGINVGINLGCAAGASITGHLHIHILPRWNGDTNFLPALAETKQVSVDLKKIYAKIKAGF